MRTTKKKRNAGLLTAAAAAYVVAAWTVAPGFNDGIAPTNAYNFVCPPAIAGAQGGVPLSGHLVIKVINGVSDANSAFTDDAQVVIGFLAGAFDVPGKTSVTVDIKPVSPCPSPSGLTFSTNAYAITADAPLLKSRTLVMSYSNLVVDPSFGYHGDSADGPWTNIGASSQARIWTINTKTDRLGYFAAGYPAGSLSNGGSQILPVTIAVLIVAVLVGSVPLTILRRRRATSDSDD